MLNLLLFIFITTVFGQDPTVITKYGNVVGESVMLDNGVIIDSYLGIPFAKPPLGDLRFSFAEEPDPWEEPFQAKVPGNACIQRKFNSASLTHRQAQFSEDCLNLNVYSAQRGESEELHPVMVYIHGGNYEAGAGFSFPSYFVAKKNVVVVTINYRLSVIGFAYSGDGVIPGNIGLADQIFALEFIQENIEAFGGDPNQVTIFGESAGASSCGLLLMSPMAEGLFHSAILESGNEFVPWGLFPPEMNPENYIFQVAVQLDCPTMSSEEMVACLRQVDAEELDQVKFNCTEGFRCAGDFRPVVDGFILPDLPENLRGTGQYNQVPEMIGLNKDESSIFIAFKPILEPEGLNRTEFDKYIQSRVEEVSASWPDPSRENDVVQAFRFQYTDWPYVQDLERNRDMLVELETDENYGSCTDRQAKLHAADNIDVYLYVFDYVRDLTPFEEWIGAYHASELDFVFGIPFLFSDENEVAYNHSAMTSMTNFTEKDAVVSEFVTTLWTNFAKFGNPTPEPVICPDESPVIWEKLNPSNLTYLHLSYNSEMRINYRQTEFAFRNDYLQYLIGGTYTGMFSHLEESMILVEI